MIYITTFDLFRYTRITRFNLFSINQISLLKHIVIIAIKIIIIDEESDFEQYVKMTDL